MRVLVASDQWSPEGVGGSARIALESAQALAAAGHSVTAVVPAGGKGGRAVENGVDVHRVVRRVPLAQSLADAVEVRRHARGLEGRFDVALAHQSTAACGLLLARTGSPLVLVFHASAAREERFRRSRTGVTGLAAGLVRAPALAALEGVAVRRARRILVLSEFSRTLLAADHPQAAARVRLVGAGVDLERFRPGDSREARASIGMTSEGPLLVTVRRLEPRMGVDVLIEALSRLPRYTLAVVGTGPEEGRLRRLAGELGVGERVRFAGRVPDADLPDWYRAADQFVLPTLAYEGFGVATAEALACGTPVLGTRAGATPELLEPLDSRLLADGTDAPDLVTAIERSAPLAEDPVFRASCREYAVRRFAWADAVGSWVAGLEEAVTGVGSPLRAPAPTALERGRP